jgi:hypothetical protein
MCGNLTYIYMRMRADWPKQRVKLARLIYHEPALEVRFMPRAAGTTRILTMGDIKGAAAQKSDRVKRNSRSLAESTRLQCGASFLALSKWNAIKTSQLPRRVPVRQEAGGRNPHGFP